jgi:hypothetical protein
VRGDRYIFALSVAGVFAGCAGDQAAIPDQPTWVDDVRPILQANCFHCHGSSASYSDYRTRRWDFYGINDDPQITALGRFADDPKTLVNPNNDDQFRVMLGYADPHAADGDRMPPPPATRLSARDLLVMARWQSAHFPRGQHNPNHPPALTTEGPGIFRIADADGDQVLGKLTCGEHELLLPRSGGYALLGMAPPCTVSLYDGFEAVTSPWP